MARMFGTSRRTRVLRFEPCESRHLFTATVWGHVWFDSNVDGFQDAANFPIPSTTVRLIDQTGRPIAATTASAQTSGFYEFVNLPAGDFQIEVEPPTGMRSTLLPIGPQWPKNQISPLTNRSDLFHLDSNTSHVIMAGLATNSPTVPIEGRVWDDRNANGRQDEGEVGIANASVELLSNDGTGLLSLSTNAAGRFVIPAGTLPPGNYALDFKRPVRESGAAAEWQISPTEAATVPDDLNSDIGVIDGRTAAFFVPTRDTASGVASIQRDAGFHRSASIVGMLVHDQQADGLEQRCYDSTAIETFRSLPSPGCDPGLADVSVSLYDSQGSLVRTVETDRFGRYTFDRLAIGSYTLGLSEIEGVRLRNGVQLADGSWRSADIDVASELTGVRLFSHLGLVSPIGTSDVVGTVWNDYDADGIRGVDDSGRAGVDVVLANPRLRYFATTVTDERGNYRFDGASILPGEYVISIFDAIAPLAIFDNYATGAKISPQNVPSATEDLDSDFQPISGSTPLLTLNAVASPADRPSVVNDVGMYHFAEVQIRPWSDTNRDGVLQQSESFVGDVEVELFDQEGRRVGAALASSDGRAVISQLRPGSYTARIASLAGIDFTSPPNPLPGGVLGSNFDHQGRVTFTVQSDGQPVLYAGLAAQPGIGQVSGIVWADVNGDGIRGLDEQPRVDVLVELLDANDVPLSFERTNSLGEYRFTGVPAGSYAIRVHAPPSTTLSPYKRGTDGSRDSDVNRFSRKSPGFALLEGQSVQRDAGIYVGPISNDAVANLRVTEVGFIAHGNSEFVEIKNVGLEPVSLTGVRFTRGVRFDFTNSGANSLFPGEHALVVGDGATLAQRFDLDTINVAGGYLGDLDRTESLRLVDATNTTIVDFRYDDEWFVIMDSEFLPWTLTVVDEHADRTAWEHRGNWRPSSFLAGSPGSDDPRATPDPGAVVIHEVMTNPTDGWNDLIELHNTTDRPVDISYWYLGDSNRDVEPLIYLTRYQIAPGTIIPAHGYLVLSRAEHFGNPNDPGATRPFGLSSLGEAVHLIAADRDGNMMGYSDSGQFGAAEPGDVFGRVVTSTGDVIFTRLGSPTFGGPNAEPVIGDIIMDQVMYHPSREGGEFVRLVNRSNQTIDLGAFNRIWQLAGDIQYQFRPETILGPRQSILVTKLAPADFRALYPVPVDTAVVGPFIGTLGDNVGEIRVVWTEAGRTLIVDQITYGDVAPWPDVADLGGVALQRRSLNGLSADPSNWTHTARPGDANLDGRVDSDDFLIWSANQFRTSTDWTSGDFNGDRVTDGQDFQIWSASRTDVLPRVSRSGRRVPRAAGTQVVELVSNTRQAVETRMCRPSDVEAVKTDLAFESFGDPHQSRIKHERHDSVVNRSTFRSRRVRIS